MNNYIRKLISRITYFLVFTDILLISLSIKWVKEMNQPVYFLLFLAIFIVLGSAMILGFLKRHLPIILLNKQVLKKKIRLSKILEISEKKVYKDFFGLTHRLVQIKLEVYQDHEIEYLSLDEEVSEDIQISLPKYVYITFSNNKNECAIIPTFVIFVHPSLKEIIRKYEEEYKPIYCEVIQRDGLIFRDFTSNQVLEKN